MILWTKFILGQLVQLAATVVGLLLLIPFCLGQAWKYSIHPSIKDDQRIVDEWTLSWLNYIYGNPEDGVSGKTALVGPSGSSPFMPNAWAPVRAYVWSALRNSCDNLKYLFAIPGEGPIKYWWKFKFGYQLENEVNVPVLGLK